MVVPPVIIHCNGIFPNQTPSIVGYPPMDGNLGPPFRHCHGFGLMHLAGTLRAPYGGFQRWGKSPSNLGGVMAI